MQEGGSLESPPRFRQCFAESGRRWLGDEAPSAQPMVWLRMERRGRENGAEYKASRREWRGRGERKGAKTPVGQRTTPNPCEGRGFETFQAILIVLLSAGPGMFDSHHRSRCTSVASTP